MTSFFERLYKIITVSYKL